MLKNCFEKYVLKISGIYKSISDSDLVWGIQFVCICMVKNKKKIHLQHQYTNSKGYFKLEPVLNRGFKYL